TCLRLDLFLWLFVLRIQGFVEVGRLLIGILSYHLARRIQNLDSYRIFRCFFYVVIDYRAWRRIFPDSYGLGHVFHVVHAISGGRRIEEDALVGYVIAKLPQRREIVENPERAAVGG